MAPQLARQNVRQTAFELSSTAQSHRLAKFQYRNHKNQLARLTKVYGKDIQHIGNVANQISHQKEEARPQMEQNDKLIIKIKLKVPKPVKLRIRLLDAPIFNKAALSKAFSDLKDSTDKDNPATSKNDNQNSENDLFSLLERTRSGTASESGTLKSK